MAIFPSPKSRPKTVDSLRALQTKRKTVKCILWDTMDQSKETHLKEGFVIEEHKNQITILIPGFGKRNFWRIDGNEKGSISRGRGWKIAPEDLSTLNESFQKTI